MAIIDREIYPCRGHGNRLSCIITRLALWIVSVTVYGSKCDKPAFPSPSPLSNMPSLAHYWPPECFPSPPIGWKPGITKDIGEHLSQRVDPIVATDKSIYNHDTASRSTGYLLKTYDYEEPSNKTNYGDRTFDCFPRCSVVK